MRAKWALKDWALQVGRVGVCEVLQTGREREGGSENTERRYYSESETYNHTYLEPWLKGSWGLGVG